MDDKINLPSSSPPQTTESWTSQVWGRLKRLPPGVLCYGLAGFFVGCILWMLALIYGVFAVVPTGPFEERSFDVGIPFLALAGPFFWLTILVPVFICVCLGYTFDDGFV